jgi:hypothetical protein
MRLLTLTIITAATIACEARAQTATQLPASGVPYSDRQPLLRRRPFAPGGEFTPPPVTLPGWEPGYPYAPRVHVPIYSPYSMIHYDWLDKMQPVEALPAPVPPAGRPPMPPAIPPGPPKTGTTPPAPVKPTVPPAAPPTRPTFLPADGTP